MTNTVSNANVKSYEYVKPHLNCTLTKRNEVQQAGQNIIKLYSKV